MRSTTDSTHQQGESERRARSPRALIGIKISSCFHVSESRLWDLAMNADCLRYAWLAKKETSRRLYRVFDAYFTYQSVWCLVRPSSRQVAEASCRKHLEHKAQVHEGGNEPRDCDETQRLFNGAGMAMQAVPVFSPSSPPLRTISIISPSEAV